MLPLSILEDKADVTFLLNVFNGKNDAPKIIISI